MYYVTDYGHAYCGDTIELINIIDDDAVDLILFSPPFALTRSKEYGNINQEDYVEWFCQYIPEFIRCLSPNGSLVFELGGSYMPNSMARSIYQHELLLQLVKGYDLFLCQEFYYFNTQKLPSPVEYVNKKRVRVKDAVNTIWWLSSTDNPKANNKNVLQPYSKSMRKLIAKGIDAEVKRPSGHEITSSFAQDKGGAIPPNLLVWGNDGSNNKYLRTCREQNMKPHPDRFSKKFLEFFIKFLTDVGDVILDPFAGSNTTGEVAEKLQRKWISFELNDHYWETSKFRFNKVYEACRDAEK